MGFAGLNLTLHILPCDLCFGLGYPELVCC